MSKTSALAVSHLVDPTWLYLRYLRKPGLSLVSHQVDCDIYKKYPVVAIPCPIENIPVCGSDYITYGNKCKLCTEIL